MHQTKLIEALKTFPAKDIRRFKEYVHSPFFNKHEKTKQLLDYVCEQDLDIENEKINREKIFRHLFPKQKFDEAAFNSLVFELFKLLRDYLSYTGYHSPETKRLGLLSSLRKNKLNKIFISALSDSRQIETENSLRDEQFYFNRFQTENEADQYFIREGIRTKDNSLQSKIDNLDLFYFIVKLKSSCEMINRKNIVTNEYDFGILNELLNYLKKNISKFETAPAVIIYYQILLMLMHPEDESHFVQLKKLLNEHEGKFLITEKQMMYQYAQNYCANKINKGNAQYYRELFDLYKTILKKEIIFEGKHLSHAVYKNIVSVGLRLKEFDWTHHFINHYKEMLTPEFKENAYILNFASYYYEKRDYRNAMKLLQKVEFTDVYYHLSAKSLLLKIYYEMEETESFYSLIDAFKVYLKRNKLISKYMVEGHYHLIKFAKKIFELRTNAGGSRRATDRKKTEELTEQLKNTKNVTNALWLSEKMEECLSPKPLS